MARREARDRGALLHFAASLGSACGKLHQRFASLVRSSRRAARSIGRLLVKAWGGDQDSFLQSRLHLQHGPWKNPFQPLPMAEKWCRSILTLPCFPGLKRAEIKYVADLIARFFETSRAVSLRSARLGPDILPFKQSARGTVRADECPLWVKSRHVQRTSRCPLYPRKQTSAKRFDELPKLDCFLRAGTVPIVSVSLAFRGTAASAVHSADLPASHRGCTTWLPCPL